MSPSIVSICSLLTLQRDVYFPFRSFFIFLFFGLENFSNLVISYSLKVPKFSITKLQCCAQTNSLVFFDHTVQFVFPQHPNDQEDEILKKYTDYQVNIEDILEFYSTAQHVNGDQDLQAVFESIETIVVNPLPNNFQ